MWLGDGWRPASRWLLQPRSCRDLLRYVKMWEESRRRARKLLEKEMSKLFPFTKPMIVKPFLKRARELADILEKKGRDTEARVIRGYVDRLEWILQWYRDYATVPLFVLINLLEGLVYSGLVREEKGFFVATERYVKPLKRLAEQLKIPINDMGMADTTNIIVGIRDTAFASIKIEKLLKEVIFYCYNDPECKKWIEIYLAGVGPKKHRADYLLYLAKANPKALLEFLAKRYMAKRALRELLEVAMNA